MLRAIVGKEVNFSFPKSLYAVRDALGAVARGKRNAVIKKGKAGFYKLSVKPGVLLI